MLEAKWSPCPEICWSARNFKPNNLNLPFWVYTLSCVAMSDMQDGKCPVNFMQHVEAKRDLQFVNQLQSEWEKSSETYETKSSLEASVTMEVMKHYWPANLLAAWPICTRGFSNQVADLKYENVHSVLAPSGKLLHCFLHTPLVEKMRVCWYTFTTIDVYT